MTKSGFVKPIRTMFIISVSIVLFYRNSIKTKYNSEDTYGNTAGNLFNGGLFCENSGRIYFSNPEDDGTLYSMDLDMLDYKKIYNDRVEYINSTGNYIYYSRVNHKKEKSKPSVFAFRNAGLYRINSNGKNIISLSDTPCGLLNVNGNNIYYQHFTNKDGLKFYKTGIDGTGEKKLSDEGILPMTITDSILYYSGMKKDHNLYSMNLKNGSISTVYEGGVYAPILIKTDKNYIYYMSVTSNYSINRIELNGKNNTPVLLERCSTYNITEDGRYLYYQVDDNENNHIGVMDLTTGKSQHIKEGNYKNIHIAGNKVFFYNLETNETYYIPVGLNNTVSVFQPPVLN